MLRQTRREFLKTAGIAAASMGAMPLGSPGASNGQDADPTPPNVLFIMCDQLTASVLSCHGGPVDTPHIDRIAAEGVKFHQATCPTPFCSPTRASIITGMYPHAHGIVTNCVHVPGPGHQEGITGDDVTTEKLLSAAGYATHHYGKWHLLGEPLPYYPDMFAPGFEYTREMEQTFQKVRAGDRADWMQWYNWALPVEVAPEFQKAVDNLGGRWSDKHYAEFITKMGRLELPLAENFDVRTADLVVERIKACKGSPFMITCSFNAPHDPNVVPSPYYEAFSPEEIELPANREFREERFAGQWSREIIAGLGEPGLREFLRVYYGMVKMIDDQVGRILNALDEQGRTDETVIVFTADHGDMAAGHGMVWKSTNAFYDEIARVPLLIRYPRRFKPQESHLAADLVDLMPTLLELTGQPIPEQAQGQSLAPYLTGERDPAQARPFSFSERVARNRKGLREVGPSAGGSFMIRGQGWKYIRYPKGQEYLYHLADDPGETRNLIADPTRRPRRNELAAEMDAWLKRTGWPARG
ncbi:MAG: sulfatase-like hydrolase/transferase [Planctomycetota bacterium]